MESFGVKLPSPVNNITNHSQWIQLQDIWLASVSIILSIHIWSILHVLDEVPAWIIRLTVWELLGAIAYTQVFALLESVLVLIFFLIISFLLPKRWLSRQFVPATSLAVLVSTLWAIAAHNYDQIIRTWGVKEFLPWFILVVVSLVLTLVLVSRTEKIRRLLSSLVRRATVLSAVYLLIDGLSLIIVLFRNI